ncbi:MAG: hypothetical protein ACE5FW_01055 [Candidatus Aenigmatarchaeota archaeon]
MKKGRKSEKIRIFPLLKFLEFGPFNKLIAKILERVAGKVHILVTVGDKPAIEVIFEEPYITLDIKNPVLAAEAGLSEMMKRRGAVAFDSRRLDSLKDLGYRIKIKYRKFEYEL